MSLSKKVLNKICIFNISTSGERGNEISLRRPYIHIIIQPLFDLRITEMVDSFPAEFPILNQNYIIESVMEECLHATKQYILTC